MKFFFNAILILALAQVGCTASNRGPNQGNDMGVNVNADFAGALDLYEPPLTGYDLPPSETPDGFLISKDPETCDEATMQKSYMGCDYWPTVTANGVNPLFDFAVVVANVGANVANVTVTGPNATNQMATVQPNSIAKIYLPWVLSLKGGSAMCKSLPFGGQALSSDPLTQSTLAIGGAYHLVSSVPVIVYQFNPLEYGPSGGPAGKDWSNCKPNTDCAECQSYTNDASLLLPSTAMTGNYRVPGIHGDRTTGLFTTITATQDNTMVAVQLGANVETVAGPNSSPAPIAKGGKGTFMMNAGDVVQLAAYKTMKQFGIDVVIDQDFSGSVVQADKPVQVITGAQCGVNPTRTTGTCDHLEESVFPAETWGKRYFVTMPTGPKADTPGHTVRIYGHVNNTQLTFNPPIPGAPSMIGAGQVVDVGQMSQNYVIKSNFEVIGDQPFAVSTMQFGSSLVDPQTSNGDPSLSLFPSVEQYRTKYVFLAPDDYAKSYVDIVAPSGAQITLDGNPLTQTPSPITGNYGVIRVPLGSGMSGQHVLISDVPVGIQVIGYGDDTSYQYPGGLDLKVIAAPPPPIS